MDWSQYIYLVLLLGGSGVAYFHDSKFIVAVMWVNFIATMELSGNPLMVAVADIACAIAILSILRTKAAWTIAAIFGVMALIYPTSIIIGAAATYTIVDVLAYVQILAMGSTGFGNGIRFLRDRYRSVSNSSIHIQNQGMDAMENNPMAMDKDVGP